MYKALGHLLGRPHFEEVNIYKQIYPYGNFFAVYSRLFDQQPRLRRTYDGLAEELLEFASTHGPFIPKFEPPVIRPKFHGPMPQPFIGKGAFSISAPFEAKDIEELAISLTRKMAARGTK